MEIPGYRVIKELGRGGMATVYLAVQESLDREVALKVMSPALLADESFGSRFLREAKIVAKLSHPNVIPIYDVGTHEENYYIAMEYESGGELKKRIKAGLSPKEAVSITIQIASALQFAHSNGYIHRDVKPDNILFNAHDKALLTDFGVARAYDSSTKITAVGSVIGTPLYMSPEQVQGKTSDHRADLYSLGAVFYEMLMGHPPFRGDSAVTVAVKHMTDPVPILPEQYARLQPLFDKILNKDAEQRFQSGDEIIAALEQVDLSDLSASLPAHSDDSAHATGANPSASAVVTASEDHEDATVVRSEPLGVPVTPSPVPTKRAISKGLVGAASAGVLVIAGILYFSLRETPQPPLVQTPPAVTAQPEPASPIQQQSTPRQNSLTPSNTEQQHILDLLAAAKKDVDENRLAQPPNNNAVEKYREVLRVDPSNREADAGLLQISEDFLALTDQALKANQVDKANSYFDEAKHTYLQNPDLKNYQTRIQKAATQYEEQQKKLADQQERQRELMERQRKEAERKRLAEERKRAEQERLAREKQKEQDRLAALKVQQQKEAKARLAEIEKEKQEQKKLEQQKREQQAKIKLLTDTAATLLAQENLTVGVVDKALKIYTDIRVIDPNASVLKNGIAAVINAYGGVAQKELDNKNYDSAEAVVKKGLAIDGHSPELLKIQENIKKSQSAASAVFGGF